jgi:protease-4
MSKLFSFFKRKKTTPDSIEEVADKWVKNNYRISCVKLGLIIFIVGGTVITKNIKVTKTNAIAKIDIKGAIIPGQQTGDGSILAKKFIQATKDKSVKVIYIAANSPGGSPVQAEILHNAIKQYTKLPLSAQNQAFIEQNFSDYNPFINDEKEVTVNKDITVSADIIEDKGRKAVIVVAQEACTSACYYMVSPADVIIAHHSSLIGSIGVRVDTWEFTDLMKELKVKRVSITTGKNKAILDPYVKSTPEAEELIRKHMLNPMFTAFKEAVLSARGDKLIKNDDTLFSGLMWTGLEAKEKGLIDQVATTYQVVEVMKAEYDADIRETNPQKFTLNSLLDASNVVDYFADAVMERINAQQTIINY